MVILCPYDECQLPGVFAEDDDGLERGSTAPLSPTFRKAAEPGKDGSPVGVDNFEHGRVYFWQRSLAFSEDGEDSSSQATKSTASNRRRLDPAIQEELSVPSELGQPNDRGRRSTGICSSSIASTSRRIELPASFRQVDEGGDGVTEVHWEEKVFDFSDLEMFSQLSIS